VALRQSGSLDYFWNFRIVDSYNVNEKLIDGFIDDIYSDFDFMYYEKITFLGIKELMASLNDKSSKKYAEFKEVLKQDAHTKKLHDQKELSSTYTGERSTGGSNFEG
jgi:hypothetical protein